MGLQGPVSPSQVSKKWDNLKRKYKELRTPATGTGTDQGEATAATWPWFSAMHEAIGGRPSIDPPILFDSCDKENPAPVAAVASDGSTSAAAAVQAWEEEEEAQPGSSSLDVEPSTSATPPPGKKKKEDALLDFVKAEAAREEERFKASQQVNEASTKRFLDLFEKLVNK
ncbi:hypothetical protein OYC64_014913 [Pagothenia borchgrevinki]|uniref:Myb/SANT-like DNA-binding domain-containing protein n=1 Tax=Pagothenia borchgrevinki TaxID=8213 RepID=A0ABD2H535_PAGBO